MKASFYSLEWIKGEQPHLVHGVKNGRRPKGAIKGSNGSFIVKGNPAKLILTVITEDGNFVENNIYYDVLEASGRKRMSDKFESELEIICEDIKFNTSGSSVNSIIDISNLLSQL